MGSAFGAILSRTLQGSGFGEVVINFAPRFKHIERKMGYVERLMIGVFLSSGCPEIRNLAVWPGLHRSLGIFSTNPLLVCRITCFCGVDPGQSFRGTGVHDIELIGFRHHDSGLSQMSNVLVL